MRLSLLSSSLLGLLTLVLFSGCSFIHFGRYEATPATGNSALVMENTDLRTDKKILQQELLLARKEGQALRDALELRNYAGSDQGELAQRLRETSHELGILRAKYARLQTQQNNPENSTSSSTDNFAAAEQIANLKTQLSISESKLADRDRTLSPLQQENAHLREEVARVRRENAGLSQQVQALTLENKQVAAALSQLNNEFLAQKKALHRAEESTRATQAQLQLIASAQENTSALSAARQRTATGAEDLEATLRIAQARASKTPVAVLRTSQERLSHKAVHIVKEGDTLETIARLYYGTTQEWSRIYSENNALLRGGRALKPGMELIIPKD